MDDPEVNRQHGHFRADDLERIWRLRPEDVAQGEDFRYEDYQPELLELMRKFKLCYPLKKDGEYVAPSLLPVKQDGDLRWVPDNDLQFEVEYDFMPPGLFSRFVVSRYEDIGGSDRDEVWRDEVFFQWENARANVRTPSRAGRGAIVFRVQGRDPEARKVMLSALLRDLKLLHDETPGIVAEERIPCICDTCKGSETPTFYPHSELKLRQENNKQTIECKKPPFAEQRIDLLLGNIFAQEDALRDDAEARAAKFRRRGEDLLADGKLKDALELLRESGRGEAVDLLGQLREAERQFGGGRIEFKKEYEAAFARIGTAARGLLG